jgi:hypothetical protein
LFSIYVKLWLVHSELFKKRVGKVTLSHYRHAGDKGERMYSFYSFLASVLDGDEFISVTTWPRFTSGEKAPYTYWLGG